MKWIDSIKEWVGALTKLALMLLALAIMLHQIALPATHLQRCGQFVTPAQVIDLTHVYDATMPAQRGVT